MLFFFTRFVFSIEKTNRIICFFSWPRLLLWVEKIVHHSKEVKKGKRIKMYILPNAMCRSRECYSKNKTTTSFLFLKLIIFFSVLFALGQQRRQVRLNAPIKFVGHVVHHRHVMCHRKWKLTNTFNQSRQLWTQLHPLLPPVWRPDGLPASPSILVLYNNNNR